MKQHPLILVIFMLVFSYIFGALAAYPLYQTFSAPDASSFHKYARYMTLLFGIVSSFVLVRYVQTTPKAIASKPRHAWLKIIYGILFGCALFLVIESILVFLGIRNYAPDQSLDIAFVMSVLGKGLLTGMIVSILEEVLFRRNIFNVLCRQHPLWFVIVITSVIYAAVHFVDFPELDEAATITWLTAVQNLPQAGGELLNPKIWDTFLTLFLLGCLLALFRARYQTIYYCVGIHAGVVIGVKLSRKLTEYNPETTLAFFVNTTDRQQGLLASLILLIVCGVCYWWFFINQPTHRESFP